MGVPPTRSKVLVGPEKVRPMRVTSRHLTLSKSVGSPLLPPVARAVLGEDIRKGTPSELDVEFQPKNEPGGGSEFGGGGD